MGRNCQRFCSVIVAWSCLCFVVFQVVIHKTPNQYSAPSINSRYLLEKLTDPPGTTSKTEEKEFTDTDDEEDVLNIDTSPALSELETATFLQRKLHNLPYEFYVRFKYHVFSKNHSCSHFPSIYDIKFNNIYWQELITSNGTFFLYGAYYDNRPLSSIGPSIRVLGLIDRIEPTVPTYCQMWYQASQDPVVTKVLEYKYMWNKKWGNYKQGVLQPYLITCKIPDPLKGIPPVSVSLVQKPCDAARTNLRVINDRPEKKGKFAVCVKGLDFLDVDLSVRLIEWIELLSILGAEKIFLYELEVHPNISKALKYYENLGRVVVTPLTLPGDLPNFPGLRHHFLKTKITNKRQNELIPYNDCLYRNLYSYEHIALLDTDEIIMPLQTNNWNELMEIILTKAFIKGNYTRASYNFRNVYFWDDAKHSYHGWNPEIPKYMHMLQHIHRSVNYTKPNQYVKCFHNPERVLTLHNHFPLSCLEGQCTSYPVETDDAHLQHYRADCVTSLRKSCETEFKQNTTEDVNVWKYKDELISRVNETLRVLGFFKDR
ncbi:uncharacterized protein LOC136037819 isoform X2 [Artemia franciscana]|uniref:Glycosyltransferase family 92 protein n=2 Tax=Artemia franciscana TaxID=6661 RepID=A0AA88HYA9_ARTSF|nr:hypothetical protein QYM36_005681 [Artemia franciscana]